MVWIDELATTDDMDSDPSEISDAARGGDDAPRGGTTPLVAHKIAPAGTPLAIKQIKFMEGSVLKALYNNTKNCAPFMYPVDIVALNIPVSNSSVSSQPSSSRF